MVRNTPTPQLPAHDGVLATKNSFKTIEAIMPSPPGANNGGSKLAHRADSIVTEKLPQENLVTIQDVDREHLPKRTSLVKKIKGPKSSVHGSLNDTSGISTSQDPSHYNDSTGMGVVLDNHSLIMASNDNQRNGSTGFYLPRYGGNGSVSIHGSHIDIAGMGEAPNDSFDLGEIPLHLMKEYKSSYSDQISIEKFLILKVKETEKENRLLRSQLAHAKTDLKIAREDRS